MSENKYTPEPFGYFKPEPFGWTDCSETEDGAIPLFDEAAIRFIQKRRDELLAALERITSAMSKPAYDAELPNALLQAKAAITSVKGGAA